MPDISGGDIIYQIKGDMGDIKGKLNQVSSQAQKVGADFLKHSRAIGIGMTAVGASITGALGLAVKASMSFGTAMAEVSTLGVEQLGAIEEGVKKVATTYGTDLVETAKGAYQVISATGLDGAEAVGVLETATKAAAAGVSSVSEAVELGTGVMNAFGKSTADMNGIFDQAFVAVKNGVTTFDELAASVGRVAPTFAAAGLSSEEMFASITALTKGGIKTAEAVTYLRSALSNIIKPGSDALKLAADLGLEWNASALEAKGLKGFLDEVTTATGGNIEKMAQLFGSQEALTAVLALTGQQADAFASTLKEMESGVAATDEAFKRMVERDPAFAWRQMRSEMSAMAVDIGTALLPTLKELLEWLTPIIAKTREWVMANPQLTATLVKIALGVGIILSVLGPLLIVLPGIVSAFTAISSITTALAGGGALAGVAAGFGSIAIAAAPVIIAVAVLVPLVLELERALLGVNAAEAAAVESNAQADAAMQRLVQTLKAKGVALDESAMAEMSHNEKMQYINRQRDEWAKLQNMTLQEELQYRYELQQAALTQGEAAAAGAEKGAKGTMAAYDDLLKNLDPATREAMEMLSRLNPDHRESPSINDGVRDGLTKTIDIIRDSLTPLDAVLTQMWELWNRKMQAICNAVARAVKWIAEQFQRVGFAAGGVVRGPRFAAGGLMPAFAGGGMMPSMALVGERGPEVVALPRHSRVVPHQEAMNALRGGGGGGGGDITVTINNPVVRSDADLREMTRQISTTLAHTTKRAIRQQGGSTGPFR